MTLPKLPAVYILVLILSTVQSLRAEDYDYAPRDYSIIPPAPEVASLLDFKEFPVDYFRGIPEISYPIFTLKSGSISIPIMLRYHGGGIRTMQESGNAGLGWDITYGAVIGHNICGAPDDANRGERVHGLWHLNSVEKSFRTKLMSKPADYDPMDPYYTREKYSWVALEGQRYLQGLTDVANDMFSLSGLGLSAVFAFDTDKKLLLSAKNI